MARTPKAKFQRKRKPVVALVLEGKNKTERKYFENFNIRSSPYVLKIYDCESTDIKSMFNRAVDIYKKEQLSKSYSDHIFVVFDLDLDENKERKFSDILRSSTFKNIEYIISNPCFEIWFMYYFNGSPKRVISSQKAKEEMKKYIPNYSESLNTYNLIPDIDSRHQEAIKNSKIKNKQYLENTGLIERNPYSTVHELVQLLLNYRNNI